ncbi:MAG TPA: tripartite tricarboxylate transporter substrate binding protein [Crenalkalicoccus sp.]|nr:tripartite tricarboxylate transporter substrate binding protein [Crenalkalicoccus sp.]
MRLSRRAALAVAALAPVRARGAGFPAHPVTWVVPGGPGSVLDVGARLIAQKMGAALGQPVLVDNRLGAGGTIAADYAARAVPDGHTVFYGNFATFAIAPLLYANLKMDAERDFTPVHGIGASANIVVAGLERPFTTLAEMTAYGRAQPEKLTYAAGIGSGQHAAAALYAHVAGVRMTLVPYSNFSQALNDLVAGRVDVMFDYPLSSLPFVRDGRLRALAVNAPERLAVAPEVPTIAEAGCPGAELLGWAGMYAPARTPQPALDQLAAALVTALRDPEVKALFDSTGTIPWADHDAAAMRRALAEEIPRMRALIGRTGLRVE